MDVIGKVKGYFDKGVQASKQAIDKAGDAVQDFGDKSVVRIELKQLESKKETKISELGKKVYTVLSRNKQTVLTVESSEIAQLITELKKTDRDINKCKKVLSEEKVKDRQS
jgi:hypothetical protein